MNNALSIKGVKLAVSALLAAVAFMALGLAIGAKQANASTVGDNIDPEFNYVGLNISAAGNDVDSLVLKPPTEAIKFHGTYTDTAGNFELPQSGGLEFPKVLVDLGLVKINGEIGLTKDGTGHFDEATGAMDLDLSLALTLGVDDIQALAQEIDIPLPGTGPLACKLAPLDVKFSTAKGWPHAGSNFADKAALTDGALAGYWRTKPSITAVKGEQAVCGMVGGFLGDVGGLWLANSTTPLDADSDMPAATQEKPTKYTCEEDGLVGTPPNCEKEQEKCPEGQTGTPPDCKKSDDGKKAAKITVVKVSKAKVKAGKKAKIKVTVKNAGNAAFNGKIKLKSSNKQVKIAKKVSIKVGPGKKVTKTIVVKATKKAKGKATITATVGGKKGKAKVTVKAAKKKRK